MTIQKQKTGLVRAYNSDRKEILRRLKERVKSWQIEKVGERPTAADIVRDMVNGGRG